MAIYGVPAVWTNLSTCLSFALTWDLKLVGKQGLGWGVGGGEGCGEERHKTTRIVFYSDQGPDEVWNNWSLGNLISLWPETDGNVHHCTILSCPNSHLQICCQWYCCHHSSPSLPPLPCLPPPPPSPPLHHWQPCWRCWWCWSCCPRPGRTAVADWPAPASGTSWLALYAVCRKTQNAQPLSTAFPLRWQHQFLLAVKRATKNLAAQLVCILSGNLITVSGGQQCNWEFLWQSNSIGFRNTNDCWGLVPSERSEKQMVNETKNSLSEFSFHNPLVPAQCVDGLQCPLDLPAHSHHKSTC